MPIPVSALIDRIQMETDRAPDNSPEWRKRVRYFLTRAQERIVRDAPFLTRQQELRVILDPDVASLTSSDLMETTDDEFVLKRVLAEGDADAAVWDLESPERHGGRLLRIESEADQLDDAYARTREFVIREVWTAQDPNDPASPFYLYVSLNRPWKGGATQDMEYRVFTKSVALPPTMGQVISAQIHDHPYGPIEAMPATSYDESHYSRYAADNVVLGIPCMFARGNTTFLQAPHVAPTAVTDDVQGWTGPEPRGSFIYAISLAFGKQELWMHQGNPSAQSILTGDISRVRPWNESNPGPSSDMVNNLLSGDSVVLTFPDYDFAEGFSAPGSLRQGRSGFKVRIWRARYSAVGALDFDNRFYLLDEVDGDAGTYIDTGAKTPDRNTPAPLYSGVQHTLEFFPSGDQRYELRIRGVCNLEPLVSDTQTPNLDAMAADLLVHLAKAAFYEASANTAYAQSAYRDYTAALHAVKRRTSTAVPPGKIIRIRKGGSSGGIVKRYQQYHTEPTETP